MQTSQLLRPLAGVAIAFGALTVFSGGRALFGGAEAAAAVGNAVPFVLWFNFLAGFAYVLTGFGLWRRARWAVRAAALLAATTAAVALAFGVQVMGGVAYEARTVGALALRLLFWMVVAIVAGAAMRKTY
jgi:hypothetical protein